MEITKEVEPRYFDDHILHEILTRLPAASLARCKVISKRWNDLISTPFLIATHAKKFTNNAIGIYTVTTYSEGGQVCYISLDDTSDVHEFPDITSTFDSRIPFMLDSARISVMAACNGLVFFKQTCPFLHMLCNPTTKSLLKVDVPIEDWHATFGLAFDPSMSLTNLKIVACTWHGPSDFYKFTTYSYSCITKTWSTSSTIIRRKYSNLFNSVSSVFFNGALHWLREKGDIIASNVKEERAYLMRLPKGVDVSSLGWYPSVWLGVAGGRLSLMTCDKGIHVWEVEDYTKGRWKLKMTIEMEDESGGGCDKRIVPVFYDGEKCVFLCWILNENKEKEYGLAVYRVWEKRWDGFRKLEGWMDKRRHFFPYIDHTVPLGF